MSVAPMDELTDILRSRFGLESFRPAQREVVEGFLAGRDALCVMPTGAGKSLCYQLPAVVRGGLCVVVSPLISLMDDQVRILREHDINAAFLNSSLSAGEQRDVMRGLLTGYTGLLYVAPERFSHGGFVDAMSRARVTMLAVDEAHCISQWGHDFRPEYSQLGQFRQAIGDPPTIALTATATDDVRADIVRLLHLREPDITITGFDRTNLMYESQRMQSNDDRDRRLVELLADQSGSAIVYCSTRKSVEQVASELGEKLKSRTVVPYHAGIQMRDRTEFQQRWVREPGAIAVATNAFGMGINKPDVRTVIHYNLPGTLEAYYQEAGRAGRDGLPARCVILYRPADRATQEFFIDKIGEGNDNIEPKTIRQRQQIARDKLELMVQYAAGHRCRRQMILDYFGDEQDIADCTCDVCRRGGGSAGDVVVDESVVMLVRKVLSAIARLNGRFGIGAVADVLGGADVERVNRYGWDKLPTYGLLKDHKRTQIREWIDRVMEAGLARQIDPDGTFKPVIELTSTGVEVMRGTRRPPEVLAEMISVPATGVRERKKGKPAATDTTQMDVDSTGRFDKLKAVRARIAREKSVPAYVICHDAVLRLIAMRVPTSLEELGTIKGMGPMKVKLYGSDLLAAID
jgi:ATP-dependent DNA helicase RecQ